MSTYGKVSIMKVSPEYDQGIDGWFKATMATGWLSLPPLMFESSPTKMHPVRDWDILGLQNFFDHAGNIDNGMFIASGALAASLLIERKVSDKQKIPFILGVGALGSALSFAVNIAYEAGVHIPPYSQKAAEAPFDVADAMYGGVGGTLVMAAFCAVAIHKKLKDREIDRRIAEDRQWLCSHSFNYSGIYDN